MFANTLESGVRRSMILKLVMHHQGLNVYRVFVINDGLGLTKTYFTESSFCSNVLMVHIQDQLSGNFYRIIGHLVLCVMFILRFLNIPP